MAMPTEFTRGLHSLLAGVPQTYERYGSAGFHMSSNSNQYLLR